MKPRPQPRTRRRAPTTLMVGFTFLLIAILLGECLKRSVGNGVLALTVSRSLTIIGWLLVWQPAGQLNRHRSGTARRWR